MEHEAIVARSSREAAVLALVDVRATKRSARAHDDDERRTAIRRVWDEHEQVYGPRKVWPQLRREGHRVERWTVDPRAPFSYLVVRFVFRNLIPRATLAAQKSTRWSAKIACPAYRRRRRTVLDAANHRGRRRVDDELTIP